MFIFMFLSTHCNIYSDHFRGSKMDPEIFIVFSNISEVIITICNKTPNSQFPVHSPFSSHRGDTSITAIAMTSLVFMHKELKNISAAQY